MRRFAASARAVFTEPRGLSPVNVPVPVPVHEKRMRALRAEGAHCRARESVYGHGHVYGRRWVVLCGATLCLVMPVSVHADVPTATSNPDELWVPVDHDDDDLDGIEDRVDDWVVGDASAGPKLPASWARDVLSEPVSVNGGGARLVSRGRPVPWARAASSPGVELQGTQVGVVRVRAPKSATPERTLVANVFSAEWLDAAGDRIDASKRRVALRRVPPEAPASPGGAAEDVVNDESVRAIFRLPEGTTAVPRLRVTTAAADGTTLDTLEDVTLEAIECPRPPAVTPPAPPLPPNKARCFTSKPLSLVVDDVDRRHPTLRDRSLRAELGGALFMDAFGSRTAIVRVGTPRAVASPAARMRMRVRAVVLRMTAGGIPAVGGSDSGAMTLVRGELGYASSMWGPCGISFGSLRDVDVHVENPPPDHMVAFSDDAGTKSSGGALRVKVEGRAVALTWGPRLAPHVVAAAFGKEVEKAGFKVVVSTNARTSAGASSSADVSVRRRDGHLAQVDWVAPSSDPGMRVDIGRVDLGDGLTHFTDVESPAGTLEERTLIKAYDDGLVETVDVFVVPFFGGSGRIGESFITSDGSSMRNVVVVDRSGIRARRSSLTLAHELGHVLLDEPGHPDDYGVDTPTRLMDSDGSDGSAFGPRRLTRSECDRAIRQSTGAGMLVPWPLTPIKLR